tara:strand:+ start:179 stop:1720 length:1542 start_codon:yes stop_codon:yes gene_type:complete
MIDFIIVLCYFVLILIIAIKGGKNKTVDADVYFLSSRNLRWPSIAISTIATNVQGYQFLGMMGSAYLYGLAQANLEINAIQGLLIAAFIFVPIFLKHRIMTVTEFITMHLGKGAGLFYSVANISLFSTITLGAALFWGAYAADQVFGEQLAVLHQDRMTRIALLIIILGIFSAIYTYLGGLNAVVKTDIIQFIIILFGGLFILMVSIHALGGWNELYIQTSNRMHLHLPLDHPTLPWTHLFGLFFLNINYWCANQTIIQRSLAAKNLKEAQKGLLVGGALKYLMALIIVIPGIALYGTLGEGLSDPDMSFPFLVNHYVPNGLRGIILCGLFASLMSTVDSTFHSIATLWSVDIYSKYIKKEPSDHQKIRAGRQAIVFSLMTSIIMGIILLYLKFENPSAAFTHTLNNLRYYINCGTTIMICAPVLLLIPVKKKVLFAFLFTLPLNLLLQYLLPNMNYFVRAFWVIFISLLIASEGKISNFSSIKRLFQSSSNSISRLGWTLLASLILIHFLFH